MLLKSEFIMMKFIVHDNKINSTINGALFSGLLITAAK